MKYINRGRKGLNYSRLKQRLT